MNNPRILNEKLSFVEDTEMDIEKGVGMVLIEGGNQILLTVGLDVQISLH